VFKRIKVAFLALMMISIFIGCSMIKPLVVEPTTFQFKLFNFEDEYGKPYYATLPIEAKELRENPMLEANFTPISQTIGVIQWAGEAIPKRIYTLFVLNAKIEWVAFAIYNTETGTSLNWIFDGKGIPQPTGKDKLQQYLQDVEQKLLNESNKTAI